MDFMIFHEQLEGDSKKCFQAELVRIGFGSAVPQSPSEVGSDIKHGWKISELNGFSNPCLMTPEGSPTSTNHLAKGPTCSIDATEIRDVFCLYTVPIDLYMIFCVYIYICVYMYAQFITKYFHVYIDCISYSFLHILCTCYEYMCVFL